MEPKLQKVVLWYIAKKQYISQTKQQNLIRCEVVTVQQVAIAPVNSDGPGRKHHMIRISASAFMYFCNSYFAFLQQGVPTDLLDV